MQRAEPKQPIRAQRAPRRVRRAFAAALIAALAGGCGSVAKREPPPRETVSKAPAPPARGGGYYLDDGPGDNPPADLDSVPDAVPRWEPLHRGAARPYTVMGQSYTPMTQLAPYRARGVASWYGRRYHGKQTSSGEIYDMYAMTAAHTTLPIPSYARVTNLANGRSVVVRVNDRGPFIGGRIIDLSYTAAHRLGLLAGGSALVEVESIVPGEAVAAAAPPAPAPPPATPAAPPPAAEAPSGGGAGGIYLQLGAFGSRDNADAYLARLQAQIDWLAGALHVFARDGLYRVHAGPYADPAQARQAAERLGQALGVKPLLLTR